MVLVGWKPLDPHLHIPSSRIRCANIIKHVISDKVRLELFNEQDFAGRYDAVIFSKNYSDETLAQAEELKKHGKKVIFDLFDNRFFAPDDSEESQANDKRLKRMIALSDHITTSTPFLKELIESYVPGRTVTPIEDALEEAIYLTPESLSRRLRSQLQLFAYKLRMKYHGDRLRLIWFGTSGDVRLKTGMADLFKLQSLLEDVRFRDRVVLTVCSNGRKTFDEHIAPWNIPTEFINWNTRTFYKVLRLNDVALIPITSNPLTRFKTNNRVITALYNNLAVIADEIPSYSEFKDAIALNDWEQGLTRYLDDPQARRKTVEEGQKIVREKYLPHIIAARWEAFLRQALSA